MGRRKIEIAPILDDRSRSVTFLKRKNGLIKKAHELGVLCGAEVAVVIFASNGKLYQYSSGDLTATLQRHAAFRGQPSESRVPKDFVSCGKAKTDLISEHGEIQAEDDDAEDEDDSSSGKLELANSPMSENAKPQAMKPGDFLFQVAEPMPTWNYTGPSDSQVRSSISAYSERHPSAAPFTHLGHVTSSPLLGGVRYSTTSSDNASGAMGLIPTRYNVFKHSEFNAAGEDAAGVSRSSPPALSFVSQHSHSGLSDMSSLVAEPCPPVSAPMLNTSAKTSGGFHLPPSIYQTNPTHPETGWSTSSSSAMMNIGVLPSSQLPGPTGGPRVQTPSSFPSNEFSVTSQSVPISRRDSFSSSAGNGMNLRTGSAPRPDSFAGAQTGVGPIRRTEGLLSSSPYYRRTADCIDLFKPEPQASGMEIEPHSSPGSQLSESSTFPVTQYIQSPSYDSLTAAQPAPLSDSSRDDQNFSLYFQSNSRDFWDPGPVTSVNDPLSTQSTRHDEWTVTESRN